MRRPEIKNGAKGTSLFRVRCGMRNFLVNLLSESILLNLCRAIIPTEIIAPNQNPNMIAVIAEVSPSIQPKPITSFASPNPIQRPSDNLHIR